MLRAMLLAGALAACQGPAGPFPAPPAERAAPPPAVPAASETWHVEVEVESFLDGHLGRVSALVTLDGGHARAHLHQGRLDVSLTLRVADGRAEGQLFVDPGPGWNGVSIPLAGDVVDGVLELDLWGVATYRPFAGLQGGERDARALDVKFRAERR